MIKHRTTQSTCRAPGSMFVTLAAWALVIHASPASTGAPLELGRQVYQDVRSASKPWPDGCRVT